MESIALAYINSNELVEGMTITIVVFLGALVYAIRPFFNFRLNRSFYFFLISVGFIVGPLSDLVYFNEAEAIAGGYLFWLIAAQFLICLVIGYGHGIIAVARSLDGYGKPSNWYYAFIPIGNLVLLFASPDKERRCSFLGTLAATAAIIAGIISFPLGGFVAMNIGMTVNQRFVAARTDEQVDAQIFKATARAFGLRHTLERVISRVKIPLKIGESTTLTAAHSTDDTIEYVYTESTELQHISDPVLMQAAKSFCMDKTFKRLMEIGATIRATYLNEEGAHLGDFQVNSARCAALALFRSAKKPPAMKSQGDGDVEIDQKGPGDWGLQRI